MTDVELGGTFCYPKLALGRGTFSSQFSLLVWAINHHLRSAVIISFSFNHTDSEVLGVSTANLRTYLEAQPPSIPGSMYSAHLRLQVVLPHIRSRRAASDPSLYDSKNPELSIKDLADTTSQIPYGGDTSPPAIVIPSSCRFHDVDPPIR